MEYEMRRRKLLVFLFFMLKRRRSRCERTAKEVRKRKVWFKKIFKKRQAKGTFNLMVQQLHLEDREIERAIFSEYRREPYSIHCKTSLQCNLIFRTNSGP